MASNDNCELDEAAEIISADFLHIGDAMRGLGMREISPGEGRRLGEEARFLLRRAEAVVARLYALG